MSRTNDVIGVLKGLQIIIKATTKSQEEYLRHIWSNSSVRDILENNLSISKECLQKFKDNPDKQIDNFNKNIKDTLERTFVVAEGLKQFTKTSFVQNVINNKNNITDDQQTQSNRIPNELSAASFKVSLDNEQLDIPSITLKELEEILSKHKLSSTPTMPSIKKTGSTDTNIKVENEQMKTTEPMNLEQFSKDEDYIKSWMDFIATHDRIEPTSAIDAKAKDELKSTPLKIADDLKQHPINIPELSSIAKQRKVPSSRISRMASFGGLFAGLGLGTVNELAKGALGLGGTTNVKEAFFNPQNAERIVDTLCKVRGAALKIGQILSIQDSSIVSPQLAQAFERVRQSADYMPNWQVAKVLATELGSDWRSKFKSFNDKPFAAASIGQVHRGELLDGTEIAIKIQYPGVAKSIESDIDNLVGMLKVWDVFPPGIFIDNIVQVAKRELVWEVDYIREAEYTDNFGKMIKNFTEYRVPKVIKDLTTKSVLTTELVPGVPLDKCFDMDYKHKKFIGNSILKLCCLELFEFRCMQTDPNWSNFLYDPIEMKLMLIDFGATRFYTKEFINNYRGVTKAAVENNKDLVLKLSKEMGFLTGYESKQMEEAHFYAVMTLGEMFRTEGEFDFGKQNVTNRIASLVPTMVAHRLCPPPEEIYSIHRKLSGIFLLCARLNIKMSCQSIYKEIVMKNSNVN